jgi:hypothetical protein
MRRLRRAGNGGPCHGAGGGWLGFPRQRLPEIIGAKVNVRASCACSKLRRTEKSWRFLRHRPTVTSMITIRFHRRFHTRLPASSPRLPGTRAHRAATSGECPAAAAPRSASAILHRPAALGVALPDLAAGLERHGAGQTRNCDPVASQGLPAPLAVAITASGTAQDEHRDP